MNGHTEAVELLLGDKELLALTRRFDRVDAAINPVLIDMDNEVKAHRFDEPVPEGDHLPEFPGRVDMQ